MFQSRTGESVARSQQGGRGKVTILVLIALAACLTIGGFSWQRWKARSAGQDPPVRKIVHPEKRHIETTVNATGIVRLRTGAEVRVGAQISGIVTQLNVSVGSHVSAGDLIAKIDSRGLSARIADAKAQIAVDESNVHKLERDLKRTHELLDAGLIPRQQAEDLEEDLRNAEAKLEKSRVDLAVVESDLPYLEIRAPISGTIASISTLQGETVAASFSTPTFVTIIADNALELIALVDETDIGGVKRGQPVVFTTETYPSREFNGVVDRIAPKATIVSGVVNYEVAIGIRAALSLLKPDMTANVTIRTSEKEALFVPHQAIHGTGKAEYVELVVGSATEKRKVITGSRDGKWDEVKKGLTEQDRVLVQMAGNKPEGATG